MSLFSGRQRWQDPEDSWVARHSLSLVLIGLLVAQTVLAVYDGAQVFRLEQPLGAEHRVWSNEFWTWWRWAYNVSLVADSFGVLLVVVLNKWLWEQGSTPDGER